MDDIKYDYLIVGAGLYGCVFAHQMAKNNKKCLIIEKRSHIGGNIYCSEEQGICVHRYGAHIFHTNSDFIWDYVNQLTPFQHFINTPVAKYKNELYNLPFNMNTFYQMWKVADPRSAMQKLEEQKRPYLNSKPSNLEEQALQLIGPDIYYKLIKGYTEKQWGREAKELPAFIIKRLPIRLNFDNNYFNDKYQGIPIKGYNDLINKLVENVETITGVDFLERRDFWLNKADRIVFTGRIDAWFDECFGKLDYRSLRFEDEFLDIESFQGNAVVNYTEREIAYTRVIEHKHFLKRENIPYTIISREYPQDWNGSNDPFYPINDIKNSDLYAKYLNEAKKNSKIVFGGRLGEYKYYDMDKVIESALAAVDKELEIFC